MNFFNIVSIIGALGVGFLFGLVYRLLLKKYSQNKIRKSGKNIENNGRALRAIIGITVLTFGVWDGGNFLLLFFSGFCFFESIFSWCGVNALLGKTQCHLD